MSEDALARPVLRLGSLTDPIRRRLYHYVAEQPEAVSRDQAAVGVDVPRHTARFHLDKLVDAGLLVAEFRRLTGRTGPGAGRPAKLYRRSRREIGVSLPARRYDLAGQVLADAVAEGMRGTPIAEALTSAARRAAVDAVEEARVALAPLTVDGEDGPLARVAAALTPYGYEPRVELAGDRDIDPRHEPGGGLELANCPFARITEQHPEVICRANQVFLGELVGLVGEGECVSEPASEGRSGGCCVRVVSRLPGSPGESSLNPAYNQG